MGLLSAVINKLCYRTGEFTLASGAKSNEYLDVRCAALHPRAASLLGCGISELPLPWGSLQAVAGVAMGGVPLAVWCSAWLATNRLVKPVLVVRKEAKSHGRGGLVDGMDNLRDQASVEAVLIEDVLTTGGSAIVAMHTLEAVDVKVRHVITVIDRQQGGRERIREAFPEAEVYSLTTLDEIRAVTEDELAYALRFLESTSAIYPTDIRPTHA